MWLLYGKRDQGCDIGCDLHPSLTWIFTAMLMKDQNAYNDFCSIFLAEDLLLLWEFIILENVPFTGSSRSAVTAVAGQLLDLLKFEA